MTRFEPRIGWAAIAATMALAGALGTTGAAAAASATQASSSGTAPRFAAIFGDHGVLQRDRPIPVWGAGQAGRRVTVSLGGHGVEATVGPDGQWRATLPPLPAGGPYVLEAVDEDGEAARAADVLVGDVFLCSGQSNMELPVSRALNAPSEIASAADDRIRLTTIVKDFDPRPQDAFRNPVAWAPASPASVADFSAACYFFARDLRRDHDIPFGLISSNWGGSNIETWMSAEALAPLGYEEPLAILSSLSEDAAGAQAAWGRRWQAWWSGQGRGEPWSPADDADWIPVPRMEPWEQWGVPALANYNGMVWYRAEVTLTAEQARQGARLSLGNVDEADQTWVNGRAVGASGSGDRLYDLPPGLLKAGRNTVVVNAYDSWAVGGLYGPPEKRALLLADGQSVLLDAGGWRYRVADIATAPPRAPWSSTSGLTTIGDAMIAPLRNYGLKGVLWYQGESNTGDAAAYRELLAGLMADWRRRFETPDLPFLIVQLANFGPPASAPGPSGWADLRESQRQAVQADPHAALAVAIDIGDRWDIHPGQKQELGRRLARAARHLVYGDPTPPSGPRPASVRREGDVVVIAFADVVDGLKTLSGAQALGFELCAGETDCRFVLAAASGSEARIAVPAGFPATVVRFCWADSPVCNLYDGSGLPAGPFREAIS